MRNSIITLLTDFGTKDHYVSAMKGILLRINPLCSIVDITHQVTPYDVKEGAFILANAYSSFPHGTIHVAVVDPGVGGTRKSILVMTTNYFFLGPDNGLFTFALQKEKVKYVIALTNSNYFLPNLTNTFHGRDIFAPVAGHLSLGMKPNRFGPEIDQWTSLFLQKPTKEKGRVTGEIVHIDDFGNLISNIEQPLLPHPSHGSSVIKIGKKTICGLKKGYWEGEKNELIALFGSGGFLEISVREGNAQKRLKVNKGDKIQFYLRSER